MSEETEDGKVADDLNYDELDPGVRDVVRLLREDGFSTCDSGDGVTKPAAGWSEEDALRVPHVFAEIGDHTDLIRIQAERMQWVLTNAGYVDWYVEATYSTRDRKSILMAFGPPPPPLEPTRSGRPCRCTPAFVAIGELIRCEACGGY